MSSVEQLADEIRDVVEGIHGRPKRHRGVQVVVAQILCSGGEPCWIAKVKFGSLIVAKSGPYGHMAADDALRTLLAETKAALGVRE